MPRTERFTGRNVDLQRLASSIENFSRVNGFETKLFLDQTYPPSWFQVQSMKTGIGRTIIGARRCLDIIGRGRPDDLEISIGTGDWGKNIVASLVTGTLTLGLGFVWAGASALAYRIFEDKLWDFIRFQIQ
jgi:hypothetical protein